MLASDLNNPEFVGPTNPDQFLSVEFLWDEPIDKNKTDKASADAGKYVPIKMPREIYVRIQKPGDLTSVIHEKLREDHKRRWPDRWRAFQVTEGLLNEDIPGWKLEEWGELSKEEIDRLKYLRFFTVEQVAMASDAQCQGIGMGAEGLRVRAREAIKHRGRNEVRAELEEKDKEIREMRERMERLEALIGAKSEETLPREELPKRGPGRPKKEEVQT